MSAILSGPYGLINVIIDVILFIANYKGDKNFIIKEIAENDFRYSGIRYIFYKSECKILIAFKDRLMYGVITGPGEYMTCLCRIILGKQQFYSI